MDRLIAPNTVVAAQADTPPTSGTAGYATDGNPATNIPATQWPAYQYNAFQEELIAILTAAGITPDRTNNAQVAAAIKAIAIAQAQAMRMQYAELLSLNTSQALPTSVVGGIVDWFGASGGVLTLMAGASIPLGSTVSIYNFGSGPLVLQVAGGTDFIFSGTASNTSITIPQFSNLVLTGKGSNEIDITGGTASAQFAPLVVGAAVAPNEAMQLGQATGRLAATQIFAAAGTFTYTPTAGVTKTIFDVYGGGGGGGGSAITVAGQISGGASGAAGGWARKTVLNPTTQTITVGAAGAGVNNGTGTTGGTSSVGSIVSATGGTGGAAGNSGSGGSGPGPSGGVGIGGDINVHGANGTGAFGVSSVPIILSGAGANSLYGAGGTSVGSTAAGTNATGNSAGGGGGACLPSSGTTTQGGNGTPGIIIATEYF